MTTDAALVYGDDQPWTPQAEAAAWKAVDAACATAAGITWDGCHKIYVLDAAAVQRMAGCGYAVTTGDPGALSATVADWYERSCGLRFISHITGTGDDNNDYTDLIPQLFTTR